MKSILIAYSGGVDSSFLLYTAKKALGKKNILAVTASSESYPAREERDAVKQARQFLVEHKIIRTSELDIKKFADNPVNRCYYCKRELFGTLAAIAKKRGYKHVIDGSTMDDLADIRYGRKAARELGVRSPLQESGLTKDDIRYLSRRAGLKSWDRPSFACLASRFAYGQRITKKRLKAIGLAEDFIKKLGFKQLRIRFHTEKIARIEVGPEEISRFLSPKMRIKVVEKLRDLGFTYIALDLLGYRTGSMNESL